MASQGKRSFFVRATAYRGEAGFLVGSRGGGGWPTSIFTPDRAMADWMADAHRAEVDGHITRAECDVIVSVALGGDWVWWANHVS